MMNENSLTKGMKKALVQVGFGVQKYGNCFCCEDDRSTIVDGRSLQALVKRALVYQGKDAVLLTGQGRELLNALLEEKGATYYLDR